MSSHPPELPALPSGLPPQIGPRRPLQACSTCHSRKVRCDAARVGFPCTRCRADRYECIPRRRKERRKKATVNIGAPDSSASNATRPIPEHIMHHAFPYYRFFRKLTNHGRDMGNGVVLPIPMAEQQTTPFPRDDLQFLQQKGAFDLPPTAVMHQCISTYFTIFHPFFPVVDKPYFLSQCNHGDGDATSVGGGPSLLLLQAIIFTACASIPIDLIHEMGFSSRGDARSCYHTKVRHLYNFGYESDDIIAIQALLLISHYFSSIVEQRHTWLYVNQAISLAQGAGLHRDAGSAPQRRLWARIWWACLARDRLISLGTGRPMHINSLDCSVPVLTTEDLEEHGDSDEDRIVKATFAEFIKLCQYAEGVLSLPLAASHPESLQEQFSLCETTLLSWMSNQGPRAHQPDGDGITFGKSAIPTLYRSVLHLLFNTLLITLRQSGHVLGENASRSTGPCLPPPGIRLAAEESTRLATELVLSDLVRFCPTICVTAILPPLVVHLQTARFYISGPDGESAGTRFLDCLKFLKQLGDIYWHANFYHDFFKLAAFNCPAIPISQDGTSTQPLPRPVNAVLRKPEAAQKRAEAPRVGSKVINIARNEKSRPRSGLTGEASEPANTGQASRSTPTSPGSDACYLSESPHTLGRQLGAEESMFLNPDFQFFDSWLHEHDVFQGLFPSA